MDLVTPPADGFEDRGGGGKTPKWAEVTPVVVVLVGVGMLTC